MKTIFITGASAGLGKATAKLFQAKGWNVIATMRNPEKETELNQLENVTLIKLDVTSPEEIGQAVRQAIATQAIDVVLNNAGYGLVGPLESVSDQQIARQMDTNLLGVIRVVKAFTPYFRERRSGLFITITSMFGLAGYPLCSLYCASKWALEGFSESMAYDLAGFGVKVKIIAPGGIQTDFAGRSLDGGQHEAYEPLAKKVSEGYSAGKVNNFSTPESIAAVVFEAATDEKDRLRYLAGPDAVSLYRHRLAVTPEADYLERKNLFAY